MRRPLAVVTALIGAVGAALYFRRGRSPKKLEADPAEELRRKLERARAEGEAEAIAEEAQLAAANDPHVPPPGQSDGPPPLTAVEPPVETEIERRRREVHERGRAAAAEMQSEATEPTSDSDQETP